MSDDPERDDSSTSPRNGVTDAASPENKAHDDVKLTAGMHNVEAQDIDADLDHRITRKLDLRLMPWLFGIWLFAFIDRSNIGNAKIDGLVDDLGLTGDKFNVALTVFYIPYILLNVPSNWILKGIGAGIYLPALITGWGLVSTFMGLTKSYAGLIVCRLLLGVFESGLFCGMILYLSMFYRRHQLLLRLALWYCAAPLSGAIGGLLAAGLSRIKYQGYNRWPWIFIVEGAITTVYGAITFLVLPHTPAQTKFLSEEEKEGAVRRLRHDALGSQADAKVDLEKFDWRWVRMAGLNINTVLDSLNFLFILVPIYSYSLFLPTIITGLGYKDVVAQLFTVPPNVVGFLAVLVVAYLSDRYKVRGPFLLSGAALGIIGYIMLLAAPSPQVAYGGTFFVAAGNITQQALYKMLTAIGVFSNSPTVCAWLSNNLAPHYVRATGTGIQTGVGNMAAFIATFSYLPTDGPKYRAGHSINLGALCLSIITTVITMLYCARENKSRSEGTRDKRLVEEEETLLGHRHPKFRYTL